MYLLSKKILILQLLPPYWRKDTWRLRMLEVLISPVFSIYQKLMVFRKENKQSLNFLPQVMVMDSLVKELSNSAKSYVADGEFRVNIYIDNTYNTVGLIDKFITKYNLAGVNYKIIIL